MTTPVPSATAEVSTLETWAAHWPAEITVADAGELIDFDLFVGDDLTATLVKTLYRVTEPGTVTDLSEVHATIDAMMRNDAEDRFSPLQDALDAGGHRVPPVVVLADGFRDGHHRLALAQLRGYTHVSAYVPRDDLPLHGI